jgi:hypothetical protein
MFRMSLVCRIVPLCCATLFAVQAMGQAPLVVRPIQDLSFGFLLPGVATTVDALQLTRSGQIEVQASIGAVFEIRYSLPSALQSPAATIPLFFGSSAGGASASRTPIDVIRFDPNAPARFRYVTTDRATFFLGGEARPRIGQPTGRYAAPVIITITNLGI